MNRSLQFLEVEMQENELANLRVQAFNYALQVLKYNGTPDQFLKEAERIFQWLIGNLTPKS